MNKIHHIVFHDDIDGIVSAAIYLHDHVLDDMYILYPASSTSRGDEFKLMVQNINLKTDYDFLVILDYEYHEKCDLWIDHHWSRSMGDKPIINDKVIYDHNSPSAARLVSRFLKSDISVVPYSDKFLDMVDIIDTANYITVDQIFNDTHPLMILRAYIERSFHSDMMLCRIVEMMSKNHFYLERTLYQLRLSETIVTELQKNDVDKTKEAMVISGNLSIIRQGRPGKYPRYAEFYIQPEVKYAVRLSNIKKNKVYFQVSYNKWYEKENKINIGRLLSGISYLESGGGHFNVGGGIVMDRHRERLLDDLCINLNDGESSMTDEEMEKVGVDKENDPIESKAESMVKTGSAKDIAEARKKAVESTEGKDEDGKKE